MNSTPLGIVHDMPAHEYHALPHVSNSMLNAMHKSPAHCYLQHLAPGRPVNAPTPAMRAGSLMHCVTLEERAVAERYAVKPEGFDSRTVAGRAWLAAHAGRELVSAGQMATAESQASALLAVPEIARILSSGPSESSVFWIDAATGLQCRARPDHLHYTGKKRVVVLDVKSAADPMHDAFSRSVYTYGYHRQQAHYSAGLRAAGLTIEAFVFAVVSSSYPFVAVPYLLDDEAVAQGEQEVAELLQQYAHCQRTGQWPATPGGYQLISLPAWAKRSTEVEVSFVE